MAKMIGTTQCNVAEIARALEHRTEEVARALLGEPSSRTRREFRWGHHGSFWLGCAGEKRGRWYDHERGEGGDLLDLIARERNISLSEAIGIASEILDHCNLPAGQQQWSPKQQNDDAGDRITAGLRLWQQSTALSGTTGERYFGERRQIPIRGLPLHHALRWNGGIGAILALMTDPTTSEAIGVHRTFLDDDGAKLDRRMVGRQGVIRISPDETITGGLGVAEGIEDALAVLISGWSPVWAATSAGAIARLPVIAGIDSITVFADADEVGLRAADACCNRWHAAGCEARVANPGGAV